MPGPVATVGSMHVCPMCSGTTPHVGGPIAQGEANVLANGKPVATIGSMCTCVGPPDTIAQGFPNILINGKPVACLGDLTAHGGTITAGEANIIVGSAAPVPSVNMPVNKIPFPKISIVDRLAHNSKIKEAEENQEKLKEEEQGEPRIYNLQWLKEKNIIRKSKVLKEVTLRAYVYNIPDGESITFKVKKPVETTDENGSTATNEEEVVELTGTVQDKKVEVTWEVEDVSEEGESTSNTQKKNNTIVSTQAESNTTPSNNVVATPASGEEKEDRFVEVETGEVKKGNWITEEGNTVIVNRNGQRAYDWEYADNPDEAKMKQNGMSDYDIFNVKLTKSYPEAYLKAEMKVTLWLFSDIEDGFGENGIRLANHFFSGGGKDFEFNQSSNPSIEMRDSERFKSFVSSLKEELKKKYEKDGTINGSTGVNLYSIRTSLPYYGVSSSLNPNVNESATFIGGIQGCVAKFKVLKNEKTQEVKVEIERVLFLDTFGAGWEDGGANGKAKQWVPGLVAMFCLQHFKNLKSPNKFRPFTVFVDIKPS
ncbi:PAAR domain-containing protein [Tenacibaculum discolor]|uniref:PAAR domain-containing protein n=1 Tax=Tenacibaculum discolor TaxID=361581 RepID=UPI000EB42A1B|nr:PAAR domain-containing protein [Tenacibaculum discolor]RLJ98630.1 putative Zn-binding protein involved in type VI secretion [Tenacibaculum discolor]